MLPIEETEEITLNIDRSPFSLVGDFAKAFIFGDFEAGECE